MLVLLAASLGFAAAPLHPSTFDARLGLGLLQMPTHSYLSHTLTWPRGNLSIAGVWGLPGGRLRPALGLHLAAGNQRWTRGEVDFETTFFRVEPRGGARIDLDDHFTLDASLGFAMDRTVQLRAGPVFSSSVAWLGRNDHWMFHFEARLAPRFYVDQDNSGENHLYNPGGSGFLAGVGVRY